MGILAVRDRRPSDLRRPRFSFVQKRPERAEAKGLKMTIGIGMLCEGGIVIAADTRTVCTDGSTAHMRKIQMAALPDSVFVAAFSSENVPATETLLSDIFSELKAHSVTSLSECEDVVRAQMVRWDASHPHGSPYTEFVFGAVLAAEHGLYYCQPPNSMNRKAYKAVGQGAAIVDPIYHILFRERKGPKTTLQQIAYLMFRAKQDYGSACGGLTNAVFLKSSPPGAYEVSIHHMSAAERSSVWLDVALQKMTDSLLSGSPFPSAESMGSGRLTWGFVTDKRQTIEDDGSIRELPPPDYSRHEGEDEQ